jgi:hypothetical protein
MLRLREGMPFGRGGIPGVTCLPAATPREGMPPKRVKACHMKV